MTEPYNDTTSSDPFGPSWDPYGAGADPVYDIPSFNETTTYETSPVGDNFFDFELPEYLNSSPVDTTSRGVPSSVSSPASPPPAESGGGFSLFGLNFSDPFGFGSMFTGGGGGTDKLAERYELGQKMKRDADKNVYTASRQKGVDLNNELLQLNINAVQAATDKANAPLLKQEWFWQALLGGASIMFQAYEQREARKQERELLNMQYRQRDKERQEEADYAAWIASQRSGGSASGARGVTRGDFENYSGGQ